MNSINATQTANVRSNVAGRSAAFVMACAVLALVMIEPAFAQGLEKVNTFVESILTLLRGVSIGVVTIAIIWAGYKFLFKHADMGEVIKIVGGALLIGAAAELARFMVGS